MNKISNNQIILFTLKPLKLGANASQSDRWLTVVPFRSEAFQQRLSGARVGSIRVCKKKKQRKEKKRKKTRKRCYCSRKNDGARNDMTSSNLRNFVTSGGRIRLDRWTSAVDNIAGFFASGLGSQSFTANLDDKHRQLSVVDSRNADPSSCLLPAAAAAASCWL